MDAKIDMARLQLLSPTVPAHQRIQILRIPGSEHPILAEIPGLTSIVNAQGAILTILRDNRLEILPGPGSFTFQLDISGWRVWFVGESRGKETIISVVSRQRL